MNVQLERYLRVLDGFTAVVDRVPDERWEQRSPCPDWTARQLLGHVIDAQRQVVGMLTGHLGPPIGDPSELGRLAAPEPRARWRHTSDGTSVVVRGIDPDAVVTTPAGASTAAAVLGIAVIEPLVHAWDLAIAADQPVTLDPDAVNAVLPAVLAAGDQLAATGMYRPTLPTRSDVSDQDRLLAALGRDPRR